MKILVSTKDNYTAIEHYRLVLPHAYVEQNGHKLRYVKSKMNDLADLTDEEIKEFDFVVFSRSIGEIKYKDVIARLKKLGTKIVFDIDDYWILPKYHYLYDIYQKQNVTQATIECLKAADMVTVATSYLADKVKEFNKNVHVLPNSMPKELAMKREIKSNRVRFGYAAGVYHLQDARVLESAVKMLYKSTNYDTFQFVLAGFNNYSKGSLIEYMTLERYMSGDYAFKRTEKDYVSWLSHVTRDAEHQANDKPYKRVWTLPILEYMDCLNNWDVSLAPLYDDVFTRGKSELKAVEAGMMGKAFICSPTQAYSKLTHRKNCLKALTDKDWYISFRQLIHNKNLLEDLKENLSEFINENYNFEKVQKQRLEIYKTL